TRIMEGGDPVRYENQMLMMLRNGFKEECYFSFSYSALTDETGKTNGVMATAWETTNEVFKTYYADAIRQLSTSLAYANTYNEVKQSLHNTIFARSSEMSYVLWYKSGHESSN